MKVYGALRAIAVVSMFVLYPEIAGAVQPGSVISENGGPAASTIQIQNATIAR